ncbi:hypothetical protein HPB48_002152 [Haemaphysalis longicornis]|uniref:Uncharacterized protein n=1 Tax=Haemaphysalis longicornis TaxID=44386 RepID=A0A9J6F7N2_HAELO|nr:hypothetical protein HPB48_002152 [Haemaphysalis longicornis]
MCHAGAVCLQGIATIASSLLPSGHLQLLPVIPRISHFKTDRHSVVICLKKVAAAILTFRVFASSQPSNLQPVASGPRPNLTPDAPGASNAPHGLAPLLLLRISGKRFLSAAEVLSGVSGPRPREKNKKENGTRKDAPTPGAHIIVKTNKQKETSPASLRDHSMQPLDLNNAALLEPGVWTLRRQKTQSSSTANVSASFFVAFASV